MAISLGMGKGTMLGVGYIKVTADTSEAESSIGKLGTGLAVGATAFMGLAAAGAATVKMASDFNNQMKMIQTQAGGSAADVRTLSAAVLGLKDVQQSPDQLAEALYHLKSVGLDNVAAMKDLKIASQLAAVGNSDLEATTNALAGAWRSGIKGAQDMGQAAATVNAIIGAGNMRMQDFVSAISTGILPSAKTFGLSLQSVGAAMALMTDEGIPAVDAATRLRMSFSLMGAPSGAANKQLKAIGLTGLQLADAMRGPGGIIGAIQLLKDHLDASGLSASQQAELLSRAFGGGRSNSAILTMLNNLDTLKKKQDQINQSMGNFPAAVVAQQQTLSAQTKIMMNSLDSIGIQIGEALIGPVTSFVSFLNSTAVPAIENFAKAFVKLIPTGSISQDLKSFFGGFSAGPPKPPTSSASTTGRPFIFGSGNSGISGPGAFGTLPAASGTPLLSGHPGGISGPGSFAAAGPVAAAPSGGGDWAKFGQELKGIFTDQLAKTLRDIATFLGDTAVAAGNLVQAISPLLQILAGIGLKTLVSLADVLAHQIGPALVAFTDFLRDNQGVLSVLLTVYLAPLLVKLTALQAIKGITAISNLAKDVVMFPINQVKTIVSGITDFTKPGGGLDDLRLKAGAAGDALKTFGGKVAGVAQEAWQTVTTQVSNFATGVKMVGQSVAQAAAAGWSKVTSAASAVGGALADAAGKATIFFQSMLSGAADLAAAGWEKITAGVSAMATATKAAAVAAWEWVASASATVAAAAREVIAWIAEKVAIVGSTIAEAAMTVAQLALNLAMSLNPLGLIVLALVAVGVGMYELWQHSQTFRDIVTGVFKDIQKAADFMWNDVLKPVFKFLVESFLSVAGSIVDGAAKMFGWVPGIGGMLKGAAAAFDKFKNDVNRSLGGIQSKTVPVQITFNGVPEGQITGHSYTSTTGFSYASGGPVNGGTPGKDSVHILAMPGEHMLTAGEVQAMGGHGAVFAMRSAIRSGNVPRYASGGPVGSFTMNVTQPASSASISAVLGPITAGIIAHTTQQIVKDYAQAFAKSLASMGGGSLTGSHLAILTAALGAAKIPPPGSLPAWIAGLNTLIGRESGWNPNAINLTDINAQNGDPSRGLAQTIMSTFMAYHVPGTSMNIFDPVANVASAARYIVANYGDISNVQQANPNLPPKGYDRGGWLPVGYTLAYNGTGRPERVISPDGAGPDGGGGTELHVHIHGPVGSSVELENWLTRALTNLSRNGRLRQLVPGA